MNKKGQIITVDLIFSLVLFMLAIGYVFRIAEANDYRMKEEWLFNDLQRIGTAAGERLVSSPDFICQVNNRPYFNCVVRASLAGANAKKLGIPSGYNFELWDETVGVKIAGNAPPAFNPNSENAQNVYSEKRNVLWFANNPTKAQLNACAGGGCTEKLIMLKVWKQ